MARIRNGIFGGFTGKIGNVEGFIRNGNAYVRPARRKSNKPPTEKQLAARMRLKVVNSFINRMTPFVGVGFALASKGQTASANNLAKGYQLNHALTGDYPNIRIDYSKVSLCRGDMQIIVDSTVSVTVEGLVFTWQTDPMMDSYSSRSQTMLMIYSPELGRSVYRIGGAYSYTRSEFVPLTAEFKGRELHCYIAFAADDRQGISNSEYLGVVVF